MITAEELVNAIAVGDSGSDITKLATVTELFTSGKPKLKFDGEEIPSEKEYESLGSYSPSIGDRVLLLGASGTWVILGKLGISGGSPSELFTLDGNTIKANYNLSIQGWLDTLDAMGGQSYIKNLKTDRIEHVGDTLGFFGKTPTRQKVTTMLPSNATLSDVITNINYLKTALKDIGIYQ